jgi:PTH1 family peptidyl-tRNA hydrolase
VKAIAGLGNPGPEYAETPHNVGFRALDACARLLKCRLRFKPRFKGRVGTTRGWEHDLALVRPETYMNDSGRAIAGVLQYYRIDPADLIVLVDDADLEAGRLRIRASGGSGGHLGLQSIIATLGSENFARVRIGIGRGRREAQLGEHVLQPIEAEDRPAIGAAVERAAVAVQCIVSDGIGEAMNRFNPRAQAAAPENSARAGGNV